MEFEIILLSFSIFLLIVCVLLAGVLLKTTEVIKKLEKKLYNDLSDFEKLAFIIDLFYRVDFSKLRPDQKELWCNWVQKNLK